MLRKFILNTDRLKFLPIPGLWSWRRTPRIWNFRTKRWITTQGPPSTAGFPLSGSRYIYISFFFFFGHRFNGAVAREPLGEDSFSDASFALGLLWKIYVCICVYVCVCGGLFYPSIDHFSFLLRVLDRWIGIRNLVWFFIGAVEERFRHRLVVEINEINF